MTISAPDYILSIKPYVPGKPLEEVQREYGIEKSVKLASNENPLGPSPKAIEAISESLASLNRYPDGSGYMLVNKLSARLGVSPSNIVLGNGSDDIIAMLARVFLKPGCEVIIPHPSFLMYEISAKASGASLVKVPLNSLSIDLDGIKNAVTGKTRMIFLCNPNNPTGTIITNDEFEKFAKDIPENVILVVDEAYIEFVRDLSCLDSMTYLDGKNPLVILRTFSKAYGLAGLRIGYGITSVEISDLLNRVRQPFNTSLPAQAGACAALDDTKFLENTIRTVHDGLDFLYESLDGMGVEYFPTQANFMLINVKKNAHEVFEAMLRQGVIVRSMTSYGYPEFIRINSGTPYENKKFIKAFEKVMG